MIWASHGTGELRYKPVQNIIRYRVLHTLDVAADNDLTGNYRLARPHWNNMARLTCNAKFPNPLQMYGWVICFEINCTWKQMSHRVMFAYRCWPDIDENLLRIPASFAGYSKRSHPNCTCSHVNVRREICQDSQHQFHREVINISHHEISVILLKVAVNLFTKTWFRIRSVNSALQACRKIAVLSPIRSQRQLASEGVYCHNAAMTKAGYPGEFGHFPWQNALIQTTKPGVLGWEYINHTFTKLGTRRSFIENTRSSVVE